MDEPKYVLFSHIPSHLIVYYLGKMYIKTGKNYVYFIGFLISTADVTSIIIIRGPTVVRMIREIIT
jgi:hypothetical protein